MSAEGKPLRNNFERPERIDVKKPGPAFGTNHYGFESYDNVYNPHVDHYIYNKAYRYPYSDYSNYIYPDVYSHYPEYDQDHGDVDAVGGGAEGEEGAADGDGSYVNDDGSLHSGSGAVRYLDANGNEIDIGLSPGRGGMVRFFFGLYVSYLCPDISQRSDGFEL